MKKQGSYCFARFSKFFLVFLLTASHLSLASAEEWITEEVLKQLSELRQEMKGLKEEVRALKDSLANQPVAAPKQGAKSVSINIANSPFIGDKSAEIAIVEFSDYQCPYCQRHFKQTLPEIEKNYIETGKVRYVMKQFPLGFHAKARDASIAALCVEKLKPGKYIKAHEAIFGGEVSLDSASYQAFAKSLGIKSSKYDSCLNDKKIASIVDQDMAEGESVGVSGTPAFLIGKIKNGKVVDGRLITGARPYSSFSRALDDLL